MTTATAASIAASIRYTTFTARPSFEKMTAAEQRSLFGKAIFGRKDVRWNARQKTIETRVTTISRDYDVQDYTLAEVADLINAGRYAEKGYNGYGYKYGREAK